MATTYKIVYENAGALAVEAEFESLRDALKYLGDSKFMRPFVIEDDGTLDVLRLSASEARERSIQLLEWPNGESTH